MPKSILEALFTEEHRLFSGHARPREENLNTQEKSVLGSHTAYDKL